MTDERPWQDAAMHTGNHQRWIACRRPAHTATNWRPTTRGTRADRLVGVLVANHLLGSIPLLWWDPFEFLSVRLQMSFYCGINWKPRATRS